MNLMLLWSTTFTIPTQLLSLPPALLRDLESAIPAQDTLRQLQKHSRRETMEALEVESMGASKPLWLPFSLTLSQPIQFWMQIQQQGLYLSPF